MKIKGAEVEAGTCNSLNGGSRNRPPGVGVNRNFAGTDPMPDRRDAEGDRPVTRILPDRRIAIVHQLIAVVFEFLAEVVEHWPRLVAGRTGETILASEGRKGIRVLTSADDQKYKNQKCGRERLHPQQLPAHVRRYPHTHAHSLQQFLTQSFCIPTNARQDWQTLACETPFTCLFWSK